VYPVNKILDVAEGYMSVCEGKIFATAGRVGRVIYARATCRKMKRMDSRGRCLLTLLTTEIRNIRGVKELSIMYGNQSVGTRIFHHDSKGEK